MGIFKKSRDGQDVDTADEGGVSSASGKTLETLYEKLFAKIGRDFVYIEDFERIIISILEHLDPDLISEIDFFSKEAAINKAFEYQDFIEKQIDGSEIYSDLINLEED